MLDIIPHIQYLVTCNDCVVLPGWGAFIASHVRAYVSDGIMYPPSRVLGFNPSVNHDDGLLVASVVRRESMPYQTAKAAVAAGVEQLRNLYDIAGFVTIPRIGTLRRDKDSNTIFTPAADSIASAEFLALPTMEVSVAVPESVNEGEKVTRISGIRGFGRVAAAVAVLVGLGITLSTPVLVDRENNHFASIPAPAVTAAKTITLPSVEAANEAFYIAKPDSSATETVAISADAPKIVPEASYYLIVSSHSNIGEAKKFVEMHQGDNLTIFESDNRYRIVAATGTTFEEARSLKADDSFNSRYPDAWVLRR